MNKEIFREIKKELMYVGIIFIIFLIIFKIIYYKDPFLTSLRFVASLFWMFVLPGCFAMLYWKEKLNFTERLVIGIGLSAAVIGIASYYLGLIGLNIGYHGYILPAVIIAAGFLLSHYKKQ